MKVPENLRQVAALRPDYLGLIFYAPSPRYVVGSLTAQEVAQLPGSVQKVGVFVNASASEIAQQVAAYQLDAVQLHGDEPAAYCEAVRNMGVQVVKVMSVGDSFDVTALAPYVPHTDFFLFDTLGKQRGGNGVPFNWALLEAYPYDTPFFLSGGITPADAAALRSLQLPALYGADINSGFEDAPGLKNISLLQGFFEELRS